MQKQLVNVLTRIDDVTVLRSYLQSRFFGGTAWRLGVIDRIATEQVQESVDDNPVRMRPFGESDRRLFLALGWDGRRSYTELGDDLGVSPRSVQRRLDKLRRNGDVVLRCDVARQLAGWNSMAFLWIAVPDGEATTIGRAIGALPETRHCSRVAGPANLALIVGLRSMEHLDHIVGDITDRWPAVTIVDRRVVLEQLKVWGRLVDEFGRTVRVIPADPWASL